jgi:flagellar hook-associated protein 3 FlgL
MIPALDTSGQQFLNLVNQISRRLETAQRRIATGIRLNRVSDDPNRIATLLRARANLSAAGQIHANLGRIQVEVDAGELALQNVVVLFERAHTLAAQGATTTQTAQTRVAIAQEIGSILEQVVGRAATQVEGRFIFSGDADGVAPYTLDLTQATPVSAYLGAAQTRVAQHPNGRTFALGRTAQEIFDSAVPEDNAFAALTALRDALLADDETAVRTALDGLGRVEAHLNSQLAYYGALQNQILEAREFGDNLRLQLRSQISEIEDADLSEAILDLNQTQIQQEAALRARASVPRTSLFDYLG